MRARIAASVLIACVLALFAISPAGERFERNAGLGLLYALRGPLEAPPEAVVIALDTQSIGWLNRNVTALSGEAGSMSRCLTPDAVALLERARNAHDVPRAIYICLLEKLAPRRPRLVVFDINFNSDDRDDEAFARALAAAGNAVLLERITNDGVVRRLAPAPPLADVARAIAVFQVDGSSTAVASGYQTVFPAAPDALAIPVAAWRIYTGLDDTGQRPVPEFQPVWYYGPSGTVATYPLRAALGEDARQLPDDMSDRAVFVGVSDPLDEQTGDHFVMPSLLGPSLRIGGVEIAATAFLNLLHGHLMVRPPALFAGGLVFAVVLASFAPGLLFGGRGGILTIVLVAGGYLATATAAFWTASAWLPVGVPLLIGTPAAAGMLLLLRYSTARQIVRRLAPRQLAEELLRQGGAGRTAPHEERATVLFLDVEGSTSLGSSLPTSLYQQVIDGYYEVASSEIESRGGVVVEYKGDGILAVFTENDAGPFHARAACLAATAISGRIGSVDVHPALSGRSRLRLRIGIHTGEVSLGAIGTESRFNFSAIGDTVNAASRLEVLGKQFAECRGDIILVSRETLESARLPEDAAVALGAETLRGRHRATDVFRIRLDEEKGELNTRML